MQYLNTEKLAATEATAEPFPHLVCEDFIAADKLEDIHRDFPMITRPGSFSLASLSPGEDFAALSEFLCSEKIAEILAEKLDADIVGRPTMLTVRGFCREKDGQIHKDSGGKMVTVLLYLNRDWGEEPGGRLRLLRGEGDFNNYFLEVAPGEGTLLAFRCDANAWHGHLPFFGERRAIQLNWVENESYRKREESRHLLSAGVKKASTVFASLAERLKKKKS